ncbi:hypothetical protein [Hyalangium rubrum]|uniref:Lipoprotein n=1 Tax=Hyalangium rubrum TaxID=3103134 RepID=A0ABU5HAL3_9BACT|nr:hypothetical protein [Hyalangium sp. s54d21]MDY7230351.1 hypothetical protein [Hyalangium sp. s54d21]
MRTFVLLLPSVLALATGCISAEFVRTDPRVTLAPKASRPQVYIDRLPERSYRSVGIIELTIPTGSSLQDVMNAAGDEGQRSGCDVVVDRSIHPVRRESGQRETSTFWRHAQHSPIPPPPAAPPVVYNSPPPGKREFVCGIWEEAEAPAQGQAPSAASPGQAGVGFTG